MGGAYEHRGGFCLRHKKREGFIDSIAGFDVWENQNIGLPLEHTSEVLIGKSLGRKRTK